MYFIPFNINELNEINLAAGTKSPLSVASLSIAVRRKIQG